MMEVALSGARSTVAQLASWCLRAEDSLKKTANIVSKNFRVTCPVLLPANTCNFDADKALYLLYNYAI